MKNPWMSMWLSAADTWASAARGLTTAEMRLHQDTVVREATWGPGSRKRAAAVRIRQTRRKAGG
jgi:hypothetical protein